MGIFLYHFGYFSDTRRRDYLYIVNVDYWVEAREEAVFSENHLISLRIYHAEYR